MELKRHRGLVNRVHLMAFLSESIPSLMDSAFTSRVAMAPRAVLDTPVEPLWSIQIAIDSMASASASWFS